MFLGWGRLLSHMLGLIFIFFISISWSSAAAVAKEGHSNQQAKVSVHNQDPLESFNRVIFAFNDKFDRYLLKPVARFYNAVLPQPMKEGVGNFFSNLGEIPTIANDALQFKFYQLANDLWRFGINSTVGIAGIFDIATRIQLKHYVNDFGLTMAYYGYTDSAYLVLPFLGSYTIRDGIALPVDYYVFSPYVHIKPWRLRNGLFVVEVVDQRARALQFESVMEEAAVDRYVFMRDAYLQNRAYQIDHNDNETIDYTKDKPVAVAGG